jgi:hypothetical protein
LTVSKAKMTPNLRMIAGVLILSTVLLLIRYV